MNASFEAVVNAVKANNNKVIDDHRVNGGELMLHGLAVVKHSQIPVALCNSKYFSLNKVYLDQEGKPHVSRDSVAGVVMKFDLTLDEAVKKYNDDQITHNGGAYVIENVVLF